MSSWPETARMHNPPLILTVDDTSENLEILRMRLEAQGYEVVEAVDGLEALDRARQLGPDLILLDIMMPRLDGIETVRRLKQDPDLRFIPVILVTAKADTNDVVHGLDAGGDDYMIGAGEAITPASGSELRRPIGYEGRTDYAAIGSVPNLASRLCGEAKAGQSA